MTATGSDAVTYRSADRIATITIDRAERMNRIDADVVEGPHAAWHRFMRDDEARVAILTGAGEKAFTAGADLGAPPSHLYRGIPGVGVPVDKPVIGAVAGWVVGGGMVLTTMCDILIAADATRFSYPEVKVGFTAPGCGSRPPEATRLRRVLHCVPAQASKLAWVPRANGCREGAHDGGEMGLRRIAKE